MKNKTAARRILVVEDDRDIARLVQLHLRDAGHEVETVFDGLAAAEKIVATSYDLVVLDLTLPGIDGLELCRRLRAKAPYVLILMLTSKGTELDRVLGLEMGADDYLTKPFSIRELLARSKALFRRAEAMRAAQEDSEYSQNADCPAMKRSGAESGILSSGKLKLEIGKRRVTLSNAVVNLTAKEFDLLHLFACHPGRVYTRTQLLDNVWGLGYEGYEHTVNSHINRLRTKIEKDAAHPHYLLTVWGVGYKFRDDD